MAQGNIMTQCLLLIILFDLIRYRFNWYKDSSDWKPFHHDSAAFNPERARNQNITVGVSFGASRELAFLAANGTFLELFPKKIEYNKWQFRKRK